MSEIKEDRLVDSNTGSVGGHVTIAITNMFIQYSVMSNTINSVQGY